MVIHASRVDDMSSYADFLRQRHHIPENRIPYYEKWVRMYRSHLERVNAHTDDADSVNDFLAALPYLSAEWQIQ
jgi:hypothetical protein